MTRTLPLHLPEPHARPVPGGVGTSADVRNDAERAWGTSARFEDVLAAQGLEGTFGARGVRGGAHGGAYGGAHGLPDPGDGETGRAGKDEDREERVEKAAGARDPKSGGEADTTAPITIHALNTLLLLGDQATLSKVGMGRGKPAQSANTSGAGEGERAGQRTGRSAGDAGSDGVPAGTSRDTEATATTRRGGPEQPTGPAAGGGPSMHDRSSERNDARPVGAAGSQADQAASGGRGEQDGNGAPTPRTIISSHETLRGLSSTERQAGANARPTPSGINGATALGGVGDGTGHGGGARGAASLARLGNLRTPERTPGVPQPATDGDGGLFASHVSRGLAAALQKGDGSVTLRLQPHALGSLRIDLAYEQGAVSATFRASTPEARGLLEQHMHALRAGLEGKGLAVDELRVELAPAEVRHAAYEPEPHSRWEPRTIAEETQRNEPSSLFHDPWGAFGDAGTRGDRGESDTREDDAAADNDDGAGTGRAPRRSPAHPYAGAPDAPAPWLTIGLDTLA